MLKAVVTDTGLRASHGQQGLLDRIEPANMLLLPRVEGPAVMQGHDQGIAKTSLVIPKRVTWRLLHQHRGDRELLGLHTVQLATGGLLAKPHRSLGFIESEFPVLLVEVGHASHHALLTQAARPFERH